MSLDYANERYIRLYTRDTTTWKLIDWRARTVLLHLLRKVDRSGVLDVGADGVAGLAAVLELPLEEIVEPGIAQLVKRGTVERTADAYILPNFLEAQETPASDAQRQRVQREKRRASKRSGDAGVTNRDAGVTDGHAASRGVTPNRTVPFLAEPNLPDSLVGSPPPACDPPTQARDSGVPVAPPRPPGQLGPLVDRAIRRLDEARRAMDPKSKLIGSRISLPQVDAEKLTARLRETDEQEREATLDHCLDVLIAAAEAKDDVGMLRIGMLAGDSSWSQWRLGTVASVTKASRSPPTAPRNSRVGYSPARPDSHTTPDGEVRILTEL